MYDNEGRNIQVNVNGHRGDEGRATKSGKWGGQRVKKEKANDVWYHPDGEQAMKDFTTTSKKTFTDVLKETQQKYKNMTKERQPCMDSDAIEITETTLSDQVPDEFEDTGGDSLLN